MRKVIVFIYIFCIISISSFSVLAAMPERVPLIVGQSVTVHTDSGGHNYIWSSSNPSVVTVSGNGTSCTITAISSGKAIVTVEYSIPHADVYYGVVGDNWSIVDNSPRYLTDATNVVVTTTAPKDSEVVEQKLGYIGESVKDEITDIYSYGAGLVPVKKEELWGYADKNFNLVIPFQFQNVGSFKNDEFAVVQVNNSNYVINTKGDFIIHEHHEIYDLQDGIIGGEKYDSNGKKFGTIMTKMVNKLQRKIFYKHSSVERIKIKQKKK